MEDPEKVEKAEGTTSVNALEVAQNDNATDLPVVTSDLLEGEGDVTITKQEILLNRDSDDDDFGGFAVATSSDAMNVEEEQGENAAAESVGETYAVGVNDAQEVAVSENNEFGESVEERHVEQKQNPSAAYEDPFGDLSTTGADSMATGTPGVTEESETSPLSNKSGVVTDTEQGSSPGDDVGYFSTHESATAIEDADYDIESDNGQESSPENDTSYFSAADSMVRDDNEDSEVNDAETEEKYEDRTTEKSEAVKTEHEDSLIENNSVTDAPEELQTIDSDALGLSEKSLQPSNGEDAAADEEKLASRVFNDASEHIAVEDSNTFPKGPVDAEAGDDEEFGDFGSFEQVDGVADTGDDPETLGGTLESNDRSGADYVQPDEELASSEDVEGPKANDDDIVDEGTVDVEPGDDEEFGVIGPFKQVYGAAESVDIPETSGSSFEDTGKYVDAALQEAESASSIGNDEEVAKEATAADPAFGDDDFGDFGTFEQAAHSPARGVDDSKEKLADDDFGDFGSVEQTDTQLMSVEGPHQMDTSEVLDRNLGEEDEFGDFTDFASGEDQQPENEVTADTVTPSVEASTLGMAPPSFQPPITSNIDPIVEKAETVFVEVFGGGSVASEAEQNAPERVVVLVNNSLVSVFCPWLTSVEGIYSFTRILIFLALFQYADGANHKQLQ